MNTNCYNKHTSQLEMSCLIDQIINILDKFIFQVQ